MFIELMIIEKTALKVSYVIGGEFVYSRWPLSGTFYLGCLYPGLHPVLLKFAPLRDQVTPPF